MATSALRTPSGLRKGKMPSTISSSASAIHNSCIAKPGHGCLPARLLHVFEEIRTRVHDHDVFFRPEAFFVGIEAAVQRIEFRCAPVSLAVYLRRLGVAFAADALGLAVSLGQQHLALTLGIGTDFLRG